jgi:DNA-binding transcriptional LysR family regulator
MSVTLRQMRLFTMVAQELSFTAAATTANITQSALTSSIRALESELGLRLFDRTTRRVRLTAEGQQFLAVTERLLGDIDASLENIRSVAMRTRGHVTLSSASSFLRYVACPAVAELARSHPGVTVRLVEQTVDVAVRAVLAGEVDFAICGLVVPHAEIASTPVVRDRFGVLGAHGNLGPGPSSLQWSELDPSRYVALASSYGIRQLIDQARGGTDPLRHPRYEVSSTASLGLLLQEGIGYGIVPAMTAQPLLEQGMVFRPLEGPVLLRELHLIKRKNRGLSPAASALVEQFAPIIASLETIEGIDVLLDCEATRRFVES